MEFALVAPILIVLMFAGLDLAQMENLQQTTQFVATACAAAEHTTPGTGQATITRNQSLFIWGATMTSHNVTTNGDGTVTCTISASADAIMPVQPFSSFSFTISASD